MIRCFILLLYAYTVQSIGYDAGGGDRTTCGRPYRAGRLYQPPCDLGRLGFCTQAGELYPWRAVRRFVKDNQGLMRRMYGDQRHGHVLKAELDDDDFEEEWERHEKNSGGYGHWRPTPVRFARFQHHDYIENDLDQNLDFDFENTYEEEPRYLRDDLTNDDVLNTKFVISEREAAIAIKLAELKAAHFRPVPHRGHYTTQRTPSSSPRTPKSTTTARPTVRSTTILKPLNATTTENNDDNLVKTDNDDSEDEGTTLKLRRKTTTETSTETTESPVLTTTDHTVESEHSTTDTTTDQTTESSVKRDPTTTVFSFTKPDAVDQKTSKPTSKISSTAKSDVAKHTGNNSVLKETYQNSGDTDHTENENIGSLKHSGEILDQTGESSEHSEVYADAEGNVKQVHPDNTPAMLFQDVEEDSFKKKGPVDYNKMKGINACPVKEEVVAPFWANNTRGEVLALLNMYPFEQYVHWEKCTFEHRQMYCREGCRCEQQYRLHRLLAYDPSNECRGIFSDWFRFPSCCICKCYDMPPEFRVTSRSPRFQMQYSEDEDNV